MHISKICLRELFHHKFVSVKHNGFKSQMELFFNFVKKSMYYITSSNKITHQTLMAFLMSLQCPYSHIASLSYFDVKTTLNFVCLLGTVETILFSFSLLLKENFFFVKKQSSGGVRLPQKIVLFPSLKAL